MFPHSSTPSTDPSESSPRLLAERHARDGHQPHQPRSAGEDGGRPHDFQLHHAMHRQRFPLTRIIRFLSNEIWNITYTQGAPEDFFTSEGSPASPSSGPSPKPSQGDRKRKSLPSSMARTATSSPWKPLASGTAKARWSYTPAPPWSRPSRPPTTASTVSRLEFNA